MNTPTSTTITPADRFAAIDRKNAAPLGSPEYRAINAAEYWESFQSSYRPEQVDAAERLIKATSAGERTDELVDEVLRLLAPAGTCEHPAGYTNLLTGDCTVCS